MYVYRYEISKNAAVNRWWLSDLISVPYEVEPSTYNGEINYTENYVERLYPVREAFISERKIENVQMKIFDERIMDQLYLPFENNRVDRTGFYYRAMHLSFIGETYLFVEEACQRDFEIYTCGGVKLWLDEELVTTFTPYSRNIPSKKLISLKLRKGINRLRIYADDLAERDTNFLFEIRYKHLNPLIGIVEVDAEEQNIKTLESFLEHCYFERDMYFDGDLIFKTIPGILDTEILLKSKISSYDCPIYEKSYKVTHRTKALNIVAIKDLPFGMYEVELSIALESTVLSRSFVIGVYSKENIKIEGNISSISGRKREALRQISLWGERKPFKILALLETHKELTQETLDLINITLNAVQQKNDNSVFYIGTLLMLLKKYRHYIDENLSAKIKEVILAYRYWIDEIGNDVMWYFSETHALQFHIAQYLAGDMFESEKFIVSDRMGDRQKDIGKSRLMGWFEHFFNNGYGDWNAITHMPLNLLGFFYLYEMAEDSEIRYLTKKCLDFTFRVITYHSFKGKLSTTFGRAYEKQLKGRELAEVAFLEWITNGIGFINQSCRATTLFALSSYEPDDASFEVDPMKNEGVTITLKQGIKGTSIYTYRTANYIMSSTQNFEAFVRGHQQHLMNVALGNTGVQTFVNHPGERSVSGKGRPSYWAGNGSVPMIRQYRNIMLMRYEICEEELVHYIHSYIPSARCNEVLISDQDVYVACDDAYMVIKFSHPIKMQQIGLNKGKEVVCEGLRHRIYIKCSEASLWSDFEDFCEVMKNTKIEYGMDNELKVMDCEHGLIEMDKSGALIVAGVPIPIFDDNEVLIERYKIKPV